MGDIQGSFANPSGQHVGWVYGSKKVHCSWNDIFGVRRMWSGFTSTTLEIRDASSICDPCFGVCTAVFAVAAVEETRWSCRIDWVQFWNRHSDNYLGV
jgi:hypothetical protein